MSHAQASTANLDRRIRRVTKIKGQILCLSLFTYQG